MKRSLKEKAVILRKQGLSYTEVLKEVPVAKSTLSLWLRSVGLSKRQKQRLTEKKLAAAKRGGLKVQKTRIEKTKQIKNRARSEVKHFIHDPLWLTGTLLYWAEGTKEKEWRPSGRVTFSNMDLEMHRLFRQWLKRYTDIGENDLRYELYIHETKDIGKAKGFWTKNLNLSNQELRVYFKRHNPKSVRKNNNIDYNGLLTIRVLKSSNLNRKIAGWIEGVIEYFK